MNVELNPEIRNETPKRPRGNPNFVKRANVVSENLTGDIWEVGNKNPEFNYVWMKNNDDAELNAAAHKGYVPATGDEKILGNPFEAVESSSGKRKIRGNRILMCCPKHMADARRKKQASQFVDARTSAINEARMMSREKGVIVKTDDDLSSSETKRENIGE
jgi:hypothetical protein